MSDHETQNTNQGDDEKRPQDWESTMQPVAGSGNSGSTEGDEFELARPRSSTDHR